MMITLKAWALRHGIDPATARQKALRGGFKTAVKVGRDWMIDEDEPKVDLRAGRGKVLQSNGIALNRRAREPQSASLMRDAQQRRGEAWRGHPR